MTQPQSVTSDGMVKAAWVPTILDPENPALSEVTALTAVDLSCYLTDTGLNPGTTEDTVTDNRLCSRQNFARAGRITDTLEFTYVYNVLSAPDDEARTALTHLTDGYVVIRWGDNYDDAFQAGDEVDVYPVQCGVQRKQPPTANTPLMIMQTMHVRAPGVQRDAIVVAS